MKRKLERKSVKKKEMKAKNEKKETIEIMKENRYCVKNRINEEIKKRK